MPRLSISVCCALAIGALLLPRAAFAEDETPYSCKRARGPVEIHFKPEVEIQELVTWAVGFTCKHFVLDPRVVLTGKKVVLMAPSQQTPEQAYQLFLVALSTVGLTVVPKGNVMRIAELHTVRHDTVPLIRTEPPTSDQVVRYVVRPTHSAPDVLAKAFSSIKSNIGDVQVLGDLVLVTDHANSVRDMVSLAKLVDVPGGTDGIYTIPIQHADATKLADKIGQILAPTPSAGAGSAGAAVSGSAPTKVLVDDRTNTLVVVASHAGFERVRALVDRLDIAIEIEGGSSMHVYQLGSAIAVDLAKTLNEAIQGGSGRSAGAPGPPAADRSPTPDTLGSSISGPARVISDAPTNKLIVISSGRDFLAIRDVIRELDVPRRQVYIEAMILEVQVGSGLELAASVHGLLPGKSRVLVGGLQTDEDLKSVTPRSLAAATGLVGGLLGPLLSSTEGWFGQSIPTFGVLFQAVADRSRANILSMPSILVLDNHPAKYKVGTNIPIQKGVVPSIPTNPISTTAVNVDRQDLLLELDVKPHIMADDSVLLEVRQESKDLGKEGPLGHTWTTRAFETNVLVRDQGTVVIGGLIQDREISSATKVPLLGDIPILGYLFRSTKKERTKTNLLIMLTPYIVKDHLDLEMIRARKQREHDEFVGSIKTLGEMPYVPAVDYRRKRGLLEEINRAVEDVELEKRARAALRPAPKVTAGAVEINEPGGTRGTAEVSAETVITAP